jgi:hypothetical protein
MAKQFTVLVSSTNDMSVNEIGELLNLVETRGIVIEEIHPENVIATDYEMEERDSEENTICRVSE